MHESVPPSTHTGRRALEVVTAVIGHRIRQESNTLKAIRLAIAMGTATPYQRLWGEVGEDVNEQFVRQPVHGERLDVGSLVATTVCCPSCGHGSDQWWVELRRR